MKEIDYRTIGRRIVFRWVNRLFFFVNALVFLYLIIATYPARFYVEQHPLMYNPALAFRANILFFVWFLILLAHFLWAFGILGSLFQRQIAREAERLRAQGYVVHAPSAPREKPKRAARLSDDGEIGFEDEAFEDVAVRRSHNHE